MAQHINDKALSKLIIKRGEKLRAGEPVGNLDKIIDPALKAADWTNYVSKYNKGVINANTNN